ncbi:LuxR C-terminal-related transcriptional regulator [Bradyrhizobium japonicum]|uniref:LuxR C-terminal-related transcriptional regulator n=1 Tax=Bradyrhizobium japonicum TaxID=375 RepID=UPI001BA78C2D|nr:LuxR C-terminal-related transcriptional regulator [Bradyrhizobium japonicum]MBR0956390.1 response regulator [Bradyrhizobium japonicum]
MLDVTADQGISARIRLVIGDRQPIVLQGLKSVLGAQDDFDVVASSSDGTSCLEAIRNLTPDVALLADTLPDLTVSEILAIAKAENLPTRLVFFTESESSYDLTAAIAAGACSAISKSASPGTMLRSLRLMTKRSVSPEQFDLSPTGTDTDGKIEKMLELLTHRERQIVRLVSEGMSNKEIARQLNLSPGTVKVHLYNIFQKLEISNRTVLATLALLQRPSGFGTLALAFLAIAIADELKASEANDMLPDDDSIGHAGEHAEHEAWTYEPWKKAILRHLIVWETAETLTQRDLFAKPSQITSPAAATEALHAAEQSLGSKPWKDYGSVGSSSPNLATPLLRGMNDTQIGGNPTPEHLFPRLASNPMSLQGGYGTFATLAGALIYALHDPQLALQSHELGKGSIDSLVAVTGENAPTKLAAINDAGAHHVDNSAPAFLAHGHQLPSAFVTTGNDGVAGEGARDQVSHGAVSDAVADNLQKPIGLLDFGHDASIGGYSRDQLMGGNVVENAVHRSPIDSNSTSSDAVFDFGSGSSRINLAAFGALAWLHMTAASKSIPPHTLAWIYNPATNETIVYVNPTDHVLDIGDRGLVEIHLQGIVSIAGSDFVGQPEGAAVAITLEELEGALISIAATDETVLSADNVHGGASESAIGTEGVWNRVADDGLRFQFGQTRAGSGASTRFRTVTSDSADATEESDGASVVSARVSSIAPAYSATAAAVGNLAFKSEPIKTDTGILSTGPNEAVGPSVATAAGTGNGNSQHASEPEPASAKSGSNPGNDAEHHAPASNAAPGSAKTAEPGGVEHGKSGHSTAATSAPEAAEIDQGVASAASAVRGNSQHASEPGPAKAAGTDSIEAGVKPGNGAEHRAPASDAARGPAKTAERGGVEHGNSGHDSHAAAASAPAAAEIVEPSIAGADSAGRSNSHHALEPGSAKAAAEARSTPDDGVGNGTEHHASAADGSRGAAKKAEPGDGVEHGNSGHDLHPSSANAPKEAEIVEPSVTTADGAGRGNSQHALEPGSAKLAATEVTEADFIPGHGIGNGAEHHAPASDGARASAAETMAEPVVAEHGNSGHGLHPTSADAPKAPEIVEPSIATVDSGGRGNSQHAWEPGSAKVAATEVTEADVVPGNGIGNGAEHHAPASDGAPAPAAEAMAEPAVAEHGNSGHSTSANTPEGGEIVEPGVAAGGDAGGGNAQQAAQSAATASEAAQPAKAVSGIGGADQELVFRFDGETAPSTLVTVVELEELSDPLDPHVSLRHEEDLEMIVKMVPHALDEHAASHGNNGPHHGIVPAPHDLLI